ncbi:MAG: hypothetical protein HLUCCA04_09745 [Oceanicaulis sp. HLUCCA04]|nr:MAG: hypothetical protein HLUCCA04_09745 [Oceanicaulis sp. HLUCCA04]
MSREIDDRKKKKALRRLDRVRRALAEAQADGDSEAAREARALLTEWEDEFLGSVEERLNTFGSAFTDPEKGALDEPLSQLQAAKLKELEAKAKGKETRPWLRSSFKPKEGGARSSFSSKRPERRSSTRDVNEDVEPDFPEASPPPGPPDTEHVPRHAPASTTPPSPQKTRPRFTVIKGGKAE